MGKKKHRRRKKGSATPGSEVLNQFVRAVKSFDSHVEPTTTEALSPYQEALKNLSKCAVELTQDHDAYYLKLLQKHLSVGLDQDEKEYRKFSFYNPEGFCEAIRNILSLCPPGKEVSDYFKEIYKDIQNLLCDDFIKLHHAVIKLVAKFESQVFKVERILNISVNNVLMFIALALADGLDDTDTLDSIIEFIFDNLEEPSMKKIMAGKHSYSDKCSAFKEAISDDSREAPLEITVNIAILYNVLMNKQIESFIFWHKVSKNPVVCVIERLMPKLYAQHLSVIAEQAQKLPKELQDSEMLVRNLLYHEMLLLHQIQGFFPVFKVISHNVKNNFSAETIDSNYVARAIQMFIFLIGKVDNLMGYSEGMEETAQRLYEQLFAICFEFVIPFWALAEAPSKAILFCLGTDNTAYLEYLKGYLEKAISETNMAISVVVIGNVFKLLLPAYQMSLKSERVRGNLLSELHELNGSSCKRYAPIKCTGTDSDSEEEEKPLISTAKVDFQKTYKINLEPFYSFSAAGKSLESVKNKLRQFERMMRENLKGLDGAGSEEANQKVSNLLWLFKADWYKQIYTNLNIEKLLLAEQDLSRRPHEKIKTYAKFAKSLLLDAIDSLSHFDSSSLSEEELTTFFSIRSGLDSDLMLFEGLLEDYTKKRDSLGKSTGKVKRYTGAGAGAGAGDGAGACSVRISEYDSDTSDTCSDATSESGMHELLGELKILRATTNLALNPSSRTFTPRAVYEYRLKNYFFIILALSQRPNPKLFSSLYLYGGAPRDIIRCRKPKDIDAFYLGTVEEFKADFSLSDDHKLIEIDKGKTLCVHIFDGIKWDILVTSERPSADFSVNKVAVRFVDRRCELTDNTGAIVSTFDTTSEITKEIETDLVDEPILMLRLIWLSEICDQEIESGLLTELSDAAKVWQDGGPPSWPKEKLAVERDKMNAYFGDHVGLTKSLLFQRLGLQEVLTEKPKTYKTASLFITVPPVAPSPEAIGLKDVSR